MPNDKSSPETETVAQQKTGGDCVSRLVLLGRGTGRTHAAEIKSLGLKVGDVISGKEVGDIPVRSWWHEVRLTVLWVGEKEVIYRKQWRANHHPDGWYDDGETANFSLSCREYYLEENKEL